MSIATQVKQRPILFNGAMVRAILEGRKTQTRRMFTPQPVYNSRKQLPWSWTPNGNDKPVREWAKDVAPARHDCWHCGFAARYSPFGVPGDQLWVRETHRNTIDDKSFAVVQYQSDGLIRSALAENNGEGDFIGTREHKQPMQRVGKNGPRWTPSIHMPRWASRITLEITDVRIEQLQSISGDDAIAEGVIDAQKYTPSLNRERFFELWDSVYGNGAADINPWVWVYEFRMIKPDAVEASSEGQDAN